tara:strand:- start:1070 stop:1351 length:282 start_codon:yes stop_codon:yes gene_type:complete
MIAKDLAAKLATDWDGFVADCHEVVDEVDDETWVNTGLKAARYEPKTFEDLCVILIRNIYFIQAEENPTQSYIQQRVCFMAHCINAWEVSCKK